MRASGWILLCAACGGDPVVPPDSSGTTGPVSIRVAKGGNPVVSARVVFQRADSSVVALAATDQAGVAAADMEPGGFVSVIDGFGVAHRDIRTFTGVQIGDALVLDLAFEPQVFAYDLLIPQSSEPTRDMYEVSTSCGGAFFPASHGADTSPMTVRMVTTCIGDIDVAVSVFADGRVPLGAFTHANLVAADNGTVDLSAETYRPSEFVSFDVSGVASRTTLSISRETLHHMTVTETAVAMNGEVAVAMPVVTGATETIAATQDQQQLYVWGPAGATNTLDVGSRLLPQLSAARYDTATNTVSWTRSGAGVDPSFASASLVFQKGVPPETWSWSILAAPTDTSIVLPVLPADAVPYDATAADIADVRVGVGHIASGFEAIRRDGRLLEEVGEFGLDQRLATILRATSLGTAGDAVLADVRP